MTIVPLVNRSIDDADRATAVLTKAPEPRRNRSTSRRLLTEVALFALGVLAYFGVRGLTETGVENARRHAADIVALERDLGMFWEPALQQAIIPHHALVTFANWVYIWGHWPAIILTALWLAIRHPDAYRFLRNAMLLSGLIGIAIFVSYPVAPPRLIDAGLLDTITVHSDSYRVLQPPAFVNQYAAMPSLHVGWDLLVGLMIFRVASRPLLRAVGLAMPVLMGSAVVVTGNHYLLDVIAGIIVALMGAFAASRLSAFTARRRVGLPVPAGTAPAPATPITRTPAAAPALTPPPRPVRPPAPATAARPTVNPAPLPIPRQAPAREPTPAQQTPAPEEFTSDLREAG